MPTYQESKLDLYDAAIAEKVLGWQYYYDGDHGTNWWMHNGKRACRCVDFHPSQNDAHAIRLMDELTSRGIAVFSTSRTGKSYLLELSDFGTSTGIVRDVRVSAPLFRLALCSATAKKFGIKIPEG